MLLFMLCSRNRASFVLTITLAKKPSSIFFSFASQTASWSRSGTGITLRVSRSPWRSNSELKAEGNFTMPRERSGTWSRTTCFKWWLFWPWRLLLACIVIPFAMRPSRCCAQFRHSTRSIWFAGNSRATPAKRESLEIQSWRWSGVPFLIRAGKCLPITATEVLVKLRKPPLDNLAGNTCNYFRFRLGPGDITLSLGAQIKRPGADLVPMPANLTAVEKQTADEVDAYERLLGDAMHGDGMLFVREDAVEAAWAIVEPILDSGSALHSYEPGSWGPHQADRLTTDVGGWHTPE